MSGVKRKKVVAVSPARHPLLEELDLKDDGGWVTSIRESLDQGDQPECWNSLLNLAQRAMPRRWLNWDSESHVNILCAYPTSPFEEIPHPDPGTEEFRAVLIGLAPDELWYAKVRAYSDEIGEQKFVQMLGRLFQSAPAAGAGRMNRPGSNRDTLRGLIWCATAVPHQTLINHLAHLTNWCVQHRTTQATTVRLALTFAGTEHCAAALRVIARAAKRPSPAGSANRLASHVELQLGITEEVSSERFIPTFEFHGAQRCEPIGGACSMEFRIDGATSNIRYLNAEGKELKSLPSAVKKAHSPRIKELKLLAKELQQTLLAQRDRIDGLFISNRTWDGLTWQRFYIDHPIVSGIARRLIWQCDGKAIIAQSDRFEDVAGGPVAVSPDSQITMWHPVFQPAEEVLQWRERLAQLSLTQPLKQAHREIYLLTEAERRTAIYSNRFASHIIKQHQFRALAGGRKWKTTMIGAWDQEPIQIASKDLPDEWKAEFWILPIDAQHHAPSGALLYLLTDQVRFYRGDDRPENLAEVPPLIFSETMRDVDLFVGVASVGNDPNWSDGGPEGRYRDYWHNYSFGDLSASASTRKEVLQRLVPRLKIAGQCSITDKFLVVRGQKRTYKIHLGSSNILMEPNDQYLCIVPDARSRANDEKVFLPFEGDSTLSIILSKALLLSEDQKITDPTITRQLGG